MVRCGAESRVKHRPEITLYAPRSVAPSESFVVTALLGARHAVAIEGLDLRFEGDARAAFGSGETRSVMTQKITRAAARLCDAREIPVGATRRRAWPTCSLLRDARIAERRR